MAKRQGFDIMKYLPLGIMAVSLVSGYTLLQSRVGNTEDKIKEVKDSVKEVSDEAQDAKDEAESLKVLQATQTAKLDSIYELVKDIKNQKK